MQTTFLESVPRVEASPDHDRISALTIESLAVRIGALQYLQQRTEPVADSVKVGGASVTGCFHIKNDSC